MRAPALVKAVEVGRSAGHFLQLAKARDVLAQKLRAEEALLVGEQALELFDQPHACIVGAEPSAARTKRIDAASTSLRAWCIG